MKVAGEALLHAPVENVWNALLDPNVLVRSIPGCERLEVTGENAYGLTVNAGVAAIRGTYSGRCELTMLEPLESLMLKAACAGGPGTIAADVMVGFTDNGDGTTLLRYDADAEVGGAIGGVGQRMLTSVSKRMAVEFFGNVEQALTMPAGVAAPPLGAPGALGPQQVPSLAAGVGAPPVGQAFVAPSRPAVGASGDFMKGLLVGGGLVLAGVVAGALAARRRG